MRLTRKQLRSIIVEAVFKETTKEALINMIDKSWEHFWKDDSDKRKAWWNEHANTGEKMTIINSLISDVETYWEDIKDSVKDMTLADWLWSGWEDVLSDMISTGAASDIMSRHMQGTPGEWDVAKGLKELLNKLFERVKYV